jgi:hypothetical protein
LKKATLNFRRRMSQLIFDYTWIIQSATWDQKWFWNSTNIIVHDCRTHSIRQTWVRVTFALWYVEENPEGSQTSLEWWHWRRHCISLEVTFDDVQNVCLTEWAIFHGSVRIMESIFLNKWETMSSCLLSVEIGGTGDFSTPMYCGMSVRWTTLIPIFGECSPQLSG